MSCANKIERKQTAQASHLFTFPHEAPIYQCCCGLFHVNICGYFCGSSAPIFSVVLYFYLLKNGTNLIFLFIVAPLLFAEIISCVFLLIGTWKKRKIYVVPFIFSNVLLLLLCVVLGVLCVTGIAEPSWKGTLIFEAFMKNTTKSIIDQDQRLDEITDVKLTLGYVLIGLMFLAVLSSLWIFIGKRLYAYFHDLDKYQRQRIRLASRQMSSIADYLSPFPYP